MTIRVEGLGNIWAEVVQDSINPWGDRFTTYRLHYPRFIHSEFMTHRMISKNASSSRAIPVKTMLEQVRNMPAKPIHWGQNQAGMQAAEESTADVILKGYAYDPETCESRDVVVDCEHAWELCAADVSAIAEAMGDAGYHKQITNRILEPFQFMNVVASGTDWENLFWLRYHKDAQPEFAELARVMYEARSKSVPMLIRAGEYHVPYVNRERLQDGTLIYVSNGEQVSATVAMEISSSCCAQASYRKLDTGLEKAKDIFRKLVGMKPLHASPFEHVGEPLTENNYMARLNAVNALKAQGLDHVEQLMYIGNVRGFIQYRKTLKDENVTIPFVPTEG